MGYENATHQTLGTDILAVLNTLKYPEEVLGSYWVERLRALQSEQWYPVSTLMELQQQLLHRGGQASLVQMGRQLFRDSHRDRLELHSAGDVIFGMEEMYRYGNRGENIGGYEVLHFTPGQALLRKSTPQHCALDEGVLYEALQTVGASGLIVHNACMQTGAKACELEVCSPVRDQRWMGGHPRIDGQIHVTASEFGH